ncbi:hypothetical protein OESDEN_15185 [Oesophagostomum dentatum]|uniref:Uncharacterized protein n=1 Tax=Oesophagostomum dentatum TaxID=61180 RepID=A0A0B1SJK6_OESDE|nr:hypothetical protein OESDEN_15185 [Oesophagostomum dentatum]
MTNNERDSILKGLFAWAEVDNKSDLGARIYRADYFGMMIIHYTGNQNVKTYRIDVVEEKDVKWNFYHGRDDIDPSNGGKWVSYTSEMKY